MKGTTKTLGSIIACALLGLAVIRTLAAQNGGCVDCIYLPDEVYCLGEGTCEEAELWVYDSDYRGCFYEKNTHNVVCWEDEQQQLGWYEVWLSETIAMCPECEFEYDQRNSLFYNPCWNDDTSCGY